MLPRVLILLQPKTSVESHRDLQIGSRRFVSTYGHSLRSLHIYVFDIGLLLFKFLKNKDRTKKWKIIGKKKNRLIM